jgi:para-nitrobenzyl esterase
MPAARGLFHRAFIMSGAMLTVGDDDAATATAQHVLDALGVDADHARDVAADRVIGVQAMMLPDIRAPHELRPVVDGSTLPCQPVDALADGVLPEVPLLIGATKDEQTRLLYHVASDLRGHFTDDDAVRRWTRDLLGERTDDMVASYRALRPDASPTELYVALATDLWVGIPVVRMAEARATAATAPVYVYRFDWQSSARDGGLRASHGLDVPFIFDNLASAALTQTGQQADALAELMADAWAAFIRTGDPSTPRTGPWPPYSLAARETMIFDVDTRVVADPDGAQRALWGDVPNEVLCRYELPIDFG